jgi:broad specificity phosphatase PhoE
MTTLLVARHGQTDWNRDHRWLGQTDRPLTAVGREQARELRTQLEAVPIDAAYASDLSRALNTARIAMTGRGVGVKPVRELRERFLGSWEGLLDTEIPERFPEAFASWKSGVGFGAPDAEPFVSLAKRVESAVRKIATDHASQTVLVVAHAGPCRVLYAMAAGLDFVGYRQSIPEPPHAVAVRYEMTDGKLKRAE